MNAPVAPATAGTLATSITRPNSKWFEVHPSLGISMMDHLFNRLDGAYPHKWRSNFPDPQAIDNWAESWVEAFEEQGITRDDVKVGLKACRSRFAWPPSCAEFIQACMPFVDAMTAYHEAVSGLEERARGRNGEWSHPAVFWTAMLLSKELMTQTYGAIKDRWASALRAQMERAEWAAIPTPAPRLVKPGETRLSKEAAAKMLLELDAAGITKDQTRGFDHLRWARRIVEAVARGDTTMTITQVNFATDALGLPRAYYAMGGS